MTELDACRILGVEPGTGMDEIKRKYRKLMHRVHPDAVLGGGAGEAQEINLAYSVLKQSPGQGKKKKKRASWDSHCRGRNYYNLDLWLRLLPEESRKQPEDLGRQIEDLLKKY